MQTPAPCKKRKERGTPILSFLARSGAPGMQINVHDASPTQGQLALADDSPERNFSQCLFTLTGEFPGGGKIIPYKDVPTGSVRIFVSDQPPK